MELRESFNLLWMNLNQKSINSDIGKKLYNRYINFPT